MDSATALMTSNILADFSDIRSHNKVDDERFAQGLRFALLISEGKNRVEAYIEAFEHTGDRVNARVLASKAVNTKWIGSIINRMIMSNHIQFADKHYSALNELYTIGMSGESERNRVDALKGFIEHTKVPQSKVDAPITINLGESVIEKLNEQLSRLASNAKLLTKGGDIIDVCEIV